MQFYIVYWYDGENKRLTGVTLVNAASKRVVKDGGNS